MHATDSCPVAHTILKEHLAIFLIGSQRPFQLEIVYDK